MILCLAACPQQNRVLCRLPAGHLGAHTACLGTRAGCKLLAVWSGGSIAVKRVPVELYERVMAGLATGRHYWPAEAGEIEVEEV